MNTASGVFFTWALGLIFVVGGIIFLVMLDINNVLYGLPYIVLGVLLCYGAFRLQMSVKRKAREGGDEPDAPAPPPDAPAA